MKTKKIIITLVIGILTCWPQKGTAIDYPYNDFTRDNILWPQYESNMRKIYNAQMAAQAAMLTENYYMEDTNSKIYNLQKDFNEYLSSFSNIITYAAEIYGLYLEIEDLGENITNVLKVVEENKQGLLAAAFNRNKTGIFTNVIVTTADLAMDIKRIIDKDVKMSEFKRHEICHNIRVKMRKVNRSLNKLTTAIRYSSFLELWHSITGHRDRYGIRSKREIARECIENWQTKVAGRFVFNI